MEHINISMCNSYIQSDTQTDIHTQREVGRDGETGEASWNSLNSILIKGFHSDKRMCFLGSETEVAKYVAFSNLI